MFSFDVLLLQNLKFCRRNLAGKIGYVVTKKQQNDFFTNQWVGPKDSFRKNAEKVARRKRYWDY